MTLLAGLGLLGCLGLLAPAPQEAEAGLRSELERYTRDARDLERFYWIERSPRREERLARFEAGWRATLEALPYEELGVEARIDWQLLDGELEAKVASRARRVARWAELERYATFLGPLRELEEARWSLAPLDPRAAAGRLAALTEEVQALAEAVRAPAEEVEDDAAETTGEAPLELGPVDALRVARAVSEAERVLDTWRGHYEAYLPEAGWWLAEPADELADALADYREKLRRELAGQEGEDDDPLVGDPIGRPALLEALHHERLAYSPEELLAIGERELAWCEAELLRAAHDLGHDDWRAALEEVKESFVPPGRQDALVAEQAREMQRFLDERELVTVDELCRETWRVQMLSRETQRVLPFAAYGGQKMLVAYPTRGMSNAEKEMSLRGNNEHFTRIVTPHELIPGHHLQGYMSARHRAWRGAFSTPFYGEGWALYWEMLLWDRGWARGPADRIGMLFWRMHRAARIVVSLRFHLGEMTPPEMIDLLVERVGHERENATAEVRRYVGDGYGPLYQCAYMIGGLALRALHAEYVDERGHTDREFHDAVLRTGPVPIELVRASLLGLSLPKAWEAAWRFAD